MQTPIKKPHPAQVPVSQYTQFNYNTKRLPPFGKRLDYLRRHGMVPRLRIVVATNWEIGKLFPRVIVSPDTNVHSLRFDYLASLHVQIVYFDRDKSILADLITEILAVKPATLSAFNMDAVKQGKRASRLIYSDAKKEAA